MSDDFRGAESTCNQLNVTERYENQDKSIELRGKKFPQLKIPWIFRKFYFTSGFAMIQSIY